ncbi:MAG TPA: AMP-binding protein [Bryobacteraceae bacterium]|nr:AMP-binding protein [Bryobacteraceae bacterium]
MTLDFFERFRENLERFPGVVALQTLSDAGRETFTYQQAAAETRRLSRYLQAKGLRPGDAAGILMENDARWGLAFLALQSAGAVVVPLDVLHQPQTLAGLIAHAECRFLLIAPRFVPLLEQIQGLLPEPLPVLVCGEPAGSFPSWSEAPPAGDETPIPLIARDLDDPLVILYTSGTTGNPKGVVLTGRNIYRNVAEALQVIGPTHRDHLLSVLPLYHILALAINLVIPLYLGARVTFLGALEAQKVFKALNEEGITIFICVPQFFYLVHRRIFQEVERQRRVKRFLFRRLLAFSRFANLHLGWNPGRFFFRQIHEKFGPSLWLFGVGGARFDVEVAGDFRDLGFKLAQAYGMSETAALITVAPPVAEAVGSVGKPLPHVEIRIDQPDENGVGEVLTRGENVMLGYWKNTEATAEAIRDGWLYTGDLGYIDSHGWLYITGRKKDVIVLSSGKNIYPEEIEYFYQSDCPLIKEMCVLGVPDPGAGEEQEVLHAVIVPDFDALRDRQVVNVFEALRYEIESLSQRVPPYKRVRSLEIRTEALPRTTTRKLRRFQVQQELGQRTAAASAPAVTPEPEPDDPVERRVRDLIRRMKDAPSIRGAMNLELDLGFTSLERAELMFGVQETFGLRIPDEEATGVFTVDDLVGAVTRRLSGELREDGQARASWSDLLRAPLTPDEERMLRAQLARRPVVEVVYYLLARIARVVVRVLLRFRVRGVERLPNQYPFLICPNHLSFIDAFLVMSTLPFRVLRRLCILGDSRYFSSGVTALVGRLGKVIPVNPDRGPQVSLRLAAEGLRRGLVLCVFPEGERSIDGKLKPFRPGASILAAEFGVPVVPAGIRGAWEVWARGSGRIRLHPVSLEFGQPLQPPAPGTPYETVTRLLQEEVRRLVE